jgi:hypothetical protein
MKRSLLLVALLLLTTCIVVGIGVVIRREKLECNVHALVLAEREMPEGWKEEWRVEPPALDRRGAKQAYGVFMQNDDETAHHTVYEYSNRTLAALHVSVDNQIFFPSVGWSWRELEGTGSLPLYADQRQIKCGHSNDPYLSDRCTAILRYGPYISDFSSTIREGVMSIDEFKQIVLRIDAQFGRCKK